MIVASVPFMWTLLRRVFKLGAFDPHGPPSKTYYSQRTARVRAHHHHGNHGSDTSSSQKSTVPQHGTFTHISAGGPDDHRQDWIARPDLKLTAKPRAGGRGYVPVKDAKKGASKPSSPQHKRGPSGSSRNTRKTDSPVEARREVDVEEGQVRQLEPWESVQLEPWNSPSSPVTPDQASFPPVGRGYTPVH